MNTKKWYRAIAEIAENEGVREARIERTSGHPRLLGVAPAGHSIKIFFSSSPSDHRAIFNVRGEIRRAIARGAPR